MFGTTNTTNKFVFNKQSRFVSVVLNGVLGLKPPAITSDEVLVSLNRESVRPEELS